MIKKLRAIFSEYSLWYQRINFEESRHIAGTNQLFAQVFLQQRWLLKTRFFSWATSRAIFFEVFPVDLETHSSLFVELPDARKPKVQVGLGWYTLSSNVITNGCRNEYKHFRLSSLGISRHCLRHCRCGNSPLSIVSADE